MSYLIQLYGLNTSEFFPERKRFDVSRMR